MTAYFDAATREVTTYATAFRDEEDKFLIALGWLENGIIAQVTRLTGDREFPDDLREQILTDIAVWRVDAGDLPETRGREHAREFRDSVRSRGCMTAFTTWLADTWSHASAS
jgi:hypothetical protein